MQKRNLSKTEIEYLFSNFDRYFPKYLDDELRQVILNRTKTDLIQKFEEYTVYPEIIPKLKEQIEKYFRQSIIPAGEMVGVVASQSIGERQTQLTLNSFHQAGLTVNTVITGVPRFLEILNATKEPKIATNHFELKDDSISSIHEMKKTIGNSLRCLLWKDITIDEKVYYEKDDEAWYESFEFFYSAEFRSHKTCISYQVNREKIFSNYLSFPQIRESIEREFDNIFVVFSPLHIGQVDIFIDLTEVKKTEFFLQQTDTKKEFLIQLFLEDVIRPKISEIQIAGVQRISDFFVSKKDDNSGFAIDTEGANLKSIVQLPMVRQETIRTNHMWEVFDMFGIEGVRKFLMEELKNIVSSDGTFINECHLMILIDLMTYNGTIQSVSRYGVKKDQNSVLTRSSFEESLEHFSKAAFFSEKESINSVSASIMCGKRSKIGTGITSLMLEWDKIKQQS
jgi:DNA-directed RNA polymerase beta' subunit